MSENDRPAENPSSFEGLDTDTEGDEDIHYCKRCRLMFTSLQDYLDHKVKHDNFKVTFQRTGRGNRNVVPKLIQKQETPKEDDPQQTKDQKDDGKENEGRKRRGRKRKKVEEVDQELVMTEKPAYFCPKCDQRFNREATLRRHVEYVHDRLGDYTSVVDDEEGGNESDAGEGSIGRVIPKNHPVVTDEGTVTPDQSIDYKKLKAASSNDKSDRPYACSVCQNRFKEINVLKSHMLTHSNKRDYLCTVEGCNFAFKTKGSLKRHIRRHTGERPYSCSACGRSFTESGALTRHFKSRIPCVNKTDNDLPRYRKRWSLVNSDSPIASTETTGIHTSTIATVITHPVDSDSQVLSGEVVDTVEITDITEAAEEVLEGEDGIPLEEVIRMSEDNLLETIYQCRICKDDFHLEDLKIHLRTHLTDLPFRCEFCHFVAEKREQLSNHLINLHPNQPKNIGQNEAESGSPVSEDSIDKEKQTQIAKEAIKQLLELPQSKLDENPGTPRAVYKCPVCSKSFRGNSNLRLHMKAHTGDRPYKCTNCEKSFVTKDTLSKHMSVHSDDRSYKCGECGKLFKRISHVREHLKIHSSDRPFPCSMCEKSFKTCNAMKVHLRTHTDIMPYVCQFCTRQFREKGSLMRHLRMHTGERPFSCKHCGKAFSEHGTLNRHLKAKVPCTRQLALMRQEQTDDTNYPTVLAEFSSVVADTQQYIATVEEEEAAVETIQDDTQTEYVVLREEDLQNVEIITEVDTGEVDTTMLEGVQLTEEYVVVTNGSEGMKILDSKTGETIAMMPLSSLTDGDNQTITMVDNEIEAVAMAPDIDVNDSLVQQAMLAANVVEEQVETTEPSEILNT